MVGLYCQGEGWLVRKLVDRGVCVVSAIGLKISPAAMRHTWQQAKPNSEWQQSLCQRDEWLLHCYIVTLLRLCFPSSSSIFSNKNCL